MFRVILSVGSGGKRIPITQGAMISRVMNTLMLILITICYFGSPTWSASANSYRSDGMPLTSVVDLNRQSFEVNAPHIRADVGTIYRSNSVNHVYVLTNETGSSLTLTGIQPSCECTTAVVGDAKTKDRPVILQPGEKKPILVSVNPAYLNVGPFTKSVILSFKEYPASPVVLDLTGILASGIMFTPSKLDFTKVQIGHPRSLYLTVSIDPCLVSDAGSLHLTSSTPDIRVSEETPARTLSNSSSEDVSPKALERNSFIVRKYEVTLSPYAAIGPISGRLFLSSTNWSASSQNIADSVSVLGDIVSSVAAMPHMVAFGNVVAGKAATKNIILTDTSQDDLSNLSIFPAYSYLSARLISPNEPVNEEKQSAGRPTIVLEVRLSPKTPIGSINTQIVVSTPGGQQLTLPVTAVVAKFKNSH